MRRLFIQFASALALVIAPMVACAGPLVSPAWLSENLDDAKLVIIDLRNKIDEGSYETFLEGHIPGAIHSDYLKDGWRVGRDGVVGL
ncbi:MAG: rhodanese-like domain-containing protein, partial [Pseudomonadota bacterium]|nr:rhodanese-like domain-containing protein [Pseudomonadota bacterium]